MLPEVGQLRGLWEAKACEELYSKDRIFHLYHYCFYIHFQPSRAHLWLEESHICKTAVRNIKSE